MTDTLLHHLTNNGVLNVTINRPDARNALDWETQQAFLNLMKTYSTSSTVRVLIITGAGQKAFCAGGDLIELSQYPTKEDGAQLTQIMSEALTLLEGAPFPSIAAIQGHALGGGAELAIACDLRWMAPTAKLGFVQAKMGLTPGWGAGQRLLRTVGYAKALQLLLQATPLPAQDLLALGVVNQVIDDPLAAAQAFAEQIATLDQDVVSAIKQILRAGITLPSDQAQAIEQGVFPPLWAAEAHLQAVDAFLNRKKDD